MLTPVDKHCSKCGELKPAAAFGRASKHASGLRSECNNCRKVERALNREATKDRALQRLYGISLVEFQALLVSQGGVCAVCKGASGSKRYAADHDHATGRVRGILCTSCNSALGLFRENNAIIERAIDYIERRAA